MDRAEQRYSMTLPGDTQVEILIPGLGIFAAANNLFEKNKAMYWTYQDCLAMAAVCSINGEQVDDVSTIMAIPAKGFSALRLIVDSLVNPNQQELDATLSTIKLLPPTDTVTADASIPPT